MVTYIDDCVARNRNRVECYRGIFDDKRFFVLESVESNDVS